MGRGNESLIEKSRSHDQDGHHAHIWYKPLKNLLFQNLQADFYEMVCTPCIPLMQLNMLRHRLMQHFTKVGGNGERYVDDHVSFVGINARMSGS